MTEDKRVNKTPSVGLISTRDGNSMDYPQFLVEQNNMILAALSNLIEQQQITNQLLERIVS